MSFFFILLNVYFFISTFAQTFENSISLSVDSDVNNYRVFLAGNHSIFDEELKQKFVIFNMENERKIHSRFGDFRSLMTSKPTSSPMSVNLHTDRHTFFVPTVTNTIVINTLCEFFFHKNNMSFLDQKFSCYVELHLRNKHKSNPTASCEMYLGESPIHCVTYLTISNTLDLPTFTVLTATVHRLKMDISTVSEPFTSIQGSSSIYAKSKPVSLSFSAQPPLIWQLADSNDAKLLLGLPIYSARPGETLPISLRMISNQVPVTSQIVHIQCIIDEKIKIITMIYNSSIITVLRNYPQIYKAPNFIHNIELQIKPGRDRTLFVFNATVVSDSAATANVAESLAPTIQCCLRSPLLDSKQRTANCGSAQILTLPVDINSMIIIPAFQTSGNMFSIYNTTIVSLRKENVRVYGVVNYRDRSARLITDQVTISTMNQGRVNISDSVVSVANIDMQYQSFINPWSLQLSIFNCRYTILAPVKMWRADSWRLVLSDKVLRPINNWRVPKHSSDGTSCGLRYKVARLKILCRLYMLDESGRKHYAGSDPSVGDNRPFLDVTNITTISQLRIHPPNIVLIDKSPDNGHFLLTANELGQSSVIELLSPESSKILASTPISVVQDPDNLHVVDLLIHCVDTMTLQRRNITDGESIQSLDDYEFITVSLSMDTQTFPCYLLVFVVFSDRSIERVASFDQSHYQMYLVNSQSPEPSSTAISDGQLVTVKWTRNTNISMYESSVCAEPKLIFTKRIIWGEIAPLSDLFGVTNSPIDNIAQISTQQRQWAPHNNVTHTKGNLLQTYLYASFATLAFFFLCLILYKIFCLKTRSRRHNSAATCYNISDPSGFLNDHNKLQIRNSNSKTFSSLGKYSTNCMKSSTTKPHSNEPYPPLLPPPGPIAANYDLTLNDPVCCESAVDSGIELGKLSNYSTNTNPSNDICCSIDQPDDNAYLYPSQFSSPLFGYYPPHKEIMESIHHNNESGRLKTISNNRLPQW